MAVKRIFTPYCPDPPGCRNYDTDSPLTVDTCKKAGRFLSKQQ